jgi:aspartyl-tRNA(Asn)/glutamyl-tRNA(Gln) amidotransferase subunit A
MTGPALSLAARIKARETTARAITEAALQRAAARGPEVNAFTAILADRALAKAAAIATLPHQNDPVA